MAITTEIEIPEDLFNAFQRYLDTHPKWDQNRGVQSALSLFLIQNGINDSRINELYMDSLFGPPS